MLANCGLVYNNGRVAPCPALTAPTLVSLMFYRFFLRDVTVGRRWWVGQEDSSTVNLGGVLPAVYSTALLMESERQMGQISPANAVLYALQGESL